MSSYELEAGIAQEVSELLEAARQVVNDYPGGLEVVAKAIGRTPQYLEAALGGAGKRAKLNVDDAVAITNFTRDYRIVNVMAKRFGMACVPLPPPTLDSDDPTQHLAQCGRDMGVLMLFLAEAFADEKVARHLADVVEQFGSFSKEVSAIAHRKAITLNELRRIEGVHGKLTQAWHGFSRNYHRPVWLGPLHANLKATTESLGQRVPKHIIGSMER